MGFPKCPKHNYGYGELSFVELSQALATCETCLGLDSVEILAHADDVAASENALTDANRLYDGDDLPLLGFSHRPVRGTRNGRLYQRRHAPPSLQLYNESVPAAFISSHKAYFPIIYHSINILAVSPGPLSAGPAGYAYTALVARSPELESFRYDYGIRFTKYISLRTMLHWWRHLYDEDAAPARFKEWVVGFFKSSLNINKVGSICGKEGLFGKAKKWVVTKLVG